MAAKRKTKERDAAEANRRFMSGRSGHLLSAAFELYLQEHRIAVRLPRSTQRCCAIPFLSSPCVHLSPSALFRACRREIT
jgi:hypothetical protein